MRVSIVFVGTDGVGGDLVSGLSAHFEVLLFRDLEAALRALPFVACRVMVTGASLWDRIRCSLRHPDLSGVRLLVISPDECCRADCKDSPAESVVVIPEVRDGSLLAALIRRFATMGPDRLPAPDPDHAPENPWSPCC